MNNATKKTIFWIGIAGLILLTLWLIKKSSKEIKTDFKVGVVYLFDHPSIRDGLDGINTRLDSIMHENNINLSIHTDNGNGDMATINRIVASYKQGKFDVIMALTTPCAKIAQNEIKDIPVVFVGITDPVKDSLVNNLSSGKGNMTGTTSKVQSVKILRKAIEFFPSMKRVGILFSPSESNSIAILDELEKQIKAMQLPVEIVKREVLQTTDMQKIAVATLKETDALFVINDSKVVSSVDILIKEAYKVNKPIFASDISSVKKGALFTNGLNYIDEGIAAANIVKEILVDKKKPEEIPVFVNEKDYFFANKKIIEKYKVSSTKLSNATIVE